jgi:hypothetical protein
MTRIQSAAVVTATLIAAALFSSAVAAQTVRVKCATRADRASVSVDGANLAAGDYTAVAASGSNNATSGVHHTVGDEVGFDFSSRPRDIRHGATAIAIDFVTDGKVTGSLIDSQGQTVATATARCKAR